MSEKWSDLKTRFISAIAMVAVALVGILLGGVLFQLMVAIACGLMVWELVGMVLPGKRDLQLQIGAIAAAGVLIGGWLPFWLAAILFAGIAYFAYDRAPREKVIIAAFTAAILLTGFSLIDLRAEAGILWILWLIIVVVATDVAGYFAGRSLGGPKFWPRISPKKTWSGTIGGWVGAAFVGMIFAAILGGGLGLLIFSVLLSMASQAGDIAESAVKRRVGVKDSSDLIPGHGGLLDRFDGLLTAAIFVLLVGPIFGIPF